MRNLGFATFICLLIAAQFAKADPGALCKNIYNNVISEMPYSPDKNSADYKKSLAQYTSRAESEQRTCLEIEAKSHNELQLVCADYQGREHDCYNKVKANPFILFHTVAACRSISCLDTVKNLFLTDDLIVACRTDDADKEKLCLSDAKSFNLSADKIKACKDTTRRTQTFKVCLETKLQPEEAYACGKVTDRDLSANNYLSCLKVASTSEDLHADKIYACAKGDDFRKCLTLPMMIAPAPGPTPAPFQTK